MQRYNQQQVFAAIPAHQRIRCPHPTCGALLFNPNGQDAQQADGDIPEPQRVRCSHCERLLCRTCTEAWGDHHLCPALLEQREEQERLSLEEVARLLAEQQLQEAEEARAETERQMREIAERQRQLQAQREQQRAQINQSEGLINATSKPCPRCRAPITHFKGHTCHHITQDQAVRSAITSSAMCVWLLGILVGVLCFVLMIVGVLHVLLAGLDVVVRTVILIAAAPLAMHSRLMIMHDTVVVLVDDIK